MWLWESELRERGFKRKSKGYWQCQNRFGLEENQHLSIFSWSEQFLPAPANGKSCCLVEVDTFHMTFLLGGEHLHFYYHEYRENEWQPVGHTSAREIDRLGHDSLSLRQIADTVAARFVEALHGVFHQRE